MTSIQTEAVQAGRLYSTVRQFVERHPAFTTGGIRSLIFNETNNGLAKSGAVIRMGRKVLINEYRFFQWLEANNDKGGTK